MDIKLKKQLNLEFWKIGKTIFWSLNAVILLTIVLDVIILSEDWLDFVLLKFFLLILFYFTYKIFNQKYGTPNLLIHLILFSFNFLALISMSYTSVGNRLLYTTLLVGLFIGFNSIAIWSTIHSLIQYLLVIGTFVLLNYYDVITDPYQILKEGGYLFLSLGLVSLFFPRTRISMLKERLTLQISANDRINYLVTELSETESSYKVLKEKVEKKENEFKFLFQQISSDLNKLETVLPEIGTQGDQKEKTEQLGSLIQNLRNQSSVYFKPININQTKNDFLIDFVDVKKVYYEVFKSFKNQITKKNLRVIEKLTDNKVLITANERMFNTVLYNIGNFVMICSKINDEIEVRLDEIDDIIVFRVINQTYGLDTSEIESYFRDVEFVNYDYKKHNDSVKIGLRISKQLTEKMNGYFNYVSSEGMGYELKLQFNTYKEA